MSRSGASTAASRAASLPAVRLGTGPRAPIRVDEDELVATLAFEGSQLEEAKVGILSAALSASILTWLLFRATALLPRRLRIRALLGTATAPT